MSLKQLPPSPKFVAKVLEYEGELDQSEIAEKTDLPQRTVRYALGRLEEHDLVESEVVDDVVGGRETGETERREAGDERLGGRLRLLLDTKRRSIRYWLL